MGRFDREQRRPKRGAITILRCLGVVAVIAVFMTMSQLWFDDYESFSLLDTYGRYGGAAVASLKTAIRTQNKFPTTIWQMDKDTFNGVFAEEKDSWRRLNPTFHYEILADTEVDSWVHDHFSHSPSLIAFWHDLRVPVARANLLRYLIMLSEGGVYTDIDTICSKPITEWLPDHFRRGRPVRAVIGLAYNQNTDPMFVRPNSFAHWSLMAQPGHPIFEAAVMRVIANLEYIARMQRTKLPLVELTDDEVLEVTGSGAFTDAVIEVLRDQTGDVSLDISRFDGMMMPTLFGDVLVLPVNAFASAQKWGEIVNAEFGDVLSKHEFKKSLDHTDHTDDTDSAADAVADGLADYAVDPKYYSLHEEDPALDSYDLPSFTE